MPEETFGEGIIPNVPPVQVDQQPDRWSQFRSKIEVPEGIDDDALVDHFLEMQERASKVEELQQQNADFQRLQAEAVARISQEKPAETVVPEVDEYALPWKLTKIDPALQQLCTIDPSTGMYVPVDRLNPAYINAAEQLNQHAREARAFVNAFTSDPAGVAEILTRKQLAEMKKTFATELAEIKKQLEPAAQFATESQAERALRSFEDKNREKLYTTDGKFTPLGAHVDFFMGELGLDAEKALAAAEKQMKLNAPVVSNPDPEPKKPVTISKVAPGGNRFIDGLSRRSRLPVDNPELEDVPPKHYGMAAFKKQYMGNGSATN